MTVTDLILQWSITAIVSLLLVSRGRLTLFHPVTFYLLFHAVAFCLRPTLIHAFDLEAVFRSMHLVPEPDLMRHALWVSSAGLAAFTVAFLAGCYGAPGVRPAAPPGMNQGDKRALLLTAGLFAVPGLAAVALTGPATEHSGYVLDLQLVLIPVALLAILAAQWRWWSLLPFLGIVATRAARVGPTPEIILGATVLLLLLWLWSHQRLRPSAAFLGAACVAAVGALLVADHRSEISDWIAGREVPNTPGGKKPSLVDRPDLAHFEALTSILATVPDKSGSFSQGAQHSEAWTDGRPALAVVGRIDGGTSASIDLHRFGTFPGLPTSLVGDGWMSGGWGGLVITVAVTGLLLGAAFGVFARRQDDPVAACFLAIVQASSLGLYHHGDSTVMRGVVYMVAPLLVWRFLANRFRQAAAAEIDRERLREERQQRRLLGTALLNPNAAPLPPEVLPQLAGLTPISRPPAAAAEPAPAAPRTAPVPPPAPSPEVRPPARWRENESR